jgi:hypothetical protein
MLSALQDYGHIEIDRRLANAVPVFDKGWPWSNKRVTQPIRNLSFSLPRRHGDPTELTGVVVAVGDDEIHIPFRDEVKGKIKTFVIDLANAHYIERSNNDFIEDEFRFLQKEIPAELKDRLREEFTRANRSTPQKPVLILG